MTAWMLALAACNSSAPALDPGCSPRDRPYAQAEASSCAFDFYDMGNRARVCTSESWDLLSEFCSWDFEGYGGCWYYDRDQVLVRSEFWGMYADEPQVCGQGIEDCTDWQPHPSCPDPADPPTSTSGCTARSAHFTVSVTLDGTPANPDGIDVHLPGLAPPADTGLEFVPMSELCTSPCGGGVFRANFWQGSCIVRVRMGAATQEQRCEDHLLPQQECVEGRDAELDFAFDSATL